VLIARRRAEEERGDVPFVAECSLTMAQNWRTAVL
jgi:hypothetical protein